MDKVSINTMELKNPDRIVIDIKDSLLEDTIDYNYDYELGFIKELE